MEVVLRCGWTVNATGTLRGFAGHSTSVTRGLTIVNKGETKLQEASVVFDQRPESLRRFIVIRRMAG